MRPYLGKKGPASSPDSQAITASSTVTHPPLPRRKLVYGTEPYAVPTIFRDGPASEACSGS